MKAVPQHHDILGNPLEIGTLVAANAYCLEICKVIKINPKMLRVIPVRPKYKGNGLLKYPSDMVVVDPKLVTFYILKNS